MRREGLGLGLSLAAAALALAWLAGEAPLAAATATEPAARVVVAPPVPEPTRCVLSNILEVLAVPQDLAPPAARRRSTPPCVPGRGSLDVGLIDGRGRTVELGPFDSFALFALDPAPDGAKAWYSRPDLEGRIVVPGLPPGRYSGTLTAATVGLLTRDDLVVTAGESTCIAFRHAGPPLEQRIAVHLADRCWRDKPRPKAQDMLLHGPAGSVRLVSSEAPDLFFFDSLPHGTYDLEVRATATRSRWLRGLAPGSGKESWLDVVKQPLEPGSGAPPTAR